MDFIIFHRHIRSNTYDPILKRIRVRSRYQVLKISTITWKLALLRKNWYRAKWREMYENGLKTTNIGWKQGKIDVRANLKCANLSTARIIWWENFHPQPRTFCICSAVERCSSFIANIAALYSAQREVTIVNYHWKQINRTIFYTPSYRTIFPIPSK